MPVRPVVRLPDHVLKRVADPVTEIGAEEKALAADLLDTMFASPSCVGVAAPQIGVSIRAFSVDVTGHRKADSCHGPFVLFNPVVIFPEIEPDRIGVAPESARARGVELTLSSDRGRALTWWVAYALARAEDRVDGGMVPRDRQKDVLASVVKDITARDYHLSTGFLGTACLMQVLSQGGAEDVAYKVATQRTYPSWGYMVEKGATTIWELWNSDTQGPEMNSRNHFAFGVVGQWFYEELAGIHPDPEAPGYKRTIIRPRPAGDLEWARAEYQSAHGPIQSAWRKGGGIFTLEVSLPANTSALVHVPLPAGGAPTVLEGEKVVFKDGKPAEKVDGVKFSRVEGGSAVFDVGSGHYSFQVKA